MPARPKLNTKIAANATASAAAALLFHTNIRYCMRKPRGKCGNDSIEKGAAFSGAPSVLIFFRGRLLVLTSAKEQHNAVHRRDGNERNDVGKIPHPVEGDIPLPIPDGERVDARVNKHRQARPRDIQRTDAPALPAQKQDAQRKGKSRLQIIQRLAHAVHRVQFVDIAGGADDREHERHEQQQHERRAESFRILFVERREQTQDRQDCHEVELQVRLGRDCAVVQRGIGEEAHQLRREERDGKRDDEFAVQLFAPAEFYAREGDDGNGNGDEKHSVRIIYRHRRSETPAPFYFFCFSARFSRAVASMSLMRFSWLTFVAEGS